MPAGVCGVWLAGKCPEHELTCEDVCLIWGGAPWVCAAPPCCMQGPTCAIGDESIVDRISLCREQRQDSQLCSQNDPRMLSSDRCLIRTRIAHRLSAAGCHPATWCRHDCTMPRSPPATLITCEALRRVRDKLIALFVAPRPGTTQFSPVRSGLTVWRRVWCVANISMNLRGLHALAVAVAVAVALVAANLPGAEAQLRSGASSMSDLQLIFQAEPGGLGRWSAPRSRDEVTRSARACKRALPAHTPPACTPARPQQCTVYGCATCVKGNFKQCAKCRAGASEQLGRRAFAGHLPQAEARPGGPQ